MSGYQLEDNLMVEMLDVSRGKSPRHSFWTRVRKPSPSYNWFSMATAIGCYMGDETAFDALSRVWKEPNDLWAQEPYPDGSHCLMTVLGLYLLRRAARRRNRLSHAKRAEDEILQFWSVYLMASTNPLEPGKNRSCFAGTRAAQPATGRGLIDYMFLIGSGWTEEKIRREAVEGKSLVNQSHRVYLHQEDFTHSEWASIYRDDLVTDVSTVMEAFKKDGFPGLEPFFKIGTRAVFDFLRLEDGMYYSVLEHNCGIDGPRWVAIGGIDGKLPIQFPPKKVPRNQHEDGFAEIDYSERSVKASGEHSGSFYHKLTDAEMLFRVRLMPSGITVEKRTKQDTPPPSEEKPKEKKKSLWEKIIDFFRSLGGRDAQR